MDIDAPALLVARERCDVHGAAVDIRAANAKQLLDFGPMDAVLYFAALEHITNEERLQSLAEAWALLSAGACSRSSRRQIGSGWRDESRHLMDDAATAFAVLPLVKAQPTAAGATGGSL